MPNNASETTSITCKNKIKWFMSKFNECNLMMIQLTPHEFYVNGCNISQFKKY